MTHRQHAPAPAPAPASTPAPAAGAPRWAVRAAQAVTLLTVPSGIWRLLLVAGLLAGYTEAGYAAAGIPGWGRVYTAAVSVGSELLALLALGLVRPWGEVVPRRIPWLGGRRVPVRAVTVVAASAAALLTAVWTPFALWWMLPHPDMTPLGAALVGFLYLPLIAWGPLLGALTLAYHRRLRGRGGPARA
ncbi:hypothetical protein [Streptomyces sp. NPDC090445]|uniref:hypothetical protein n=1 Tax=Streptomyces sp. NPDC090445 TaxID=3365963 RepID=UPI003802D111